MTLNFGRRSLVKQKIGRKSLAALSACAFLAFIGPISAKAESVQYGIPSHYLTAVQGNASWRFSGGTRTVTAPSSDDLFGTFIYYGGSSNVVDVTLDLTPTIGSTYAPLSFTGLINEVTPQNGSTQAWLSFSSSPQTVDGYTFGIDTTNDTGATWSSSACPASSPCLQLNNTSTDNRTDLYGYITASVVPEPMSLGLTGLALLGLLAFGWKRKLFTGKL